MLQKTVKLMKNMNSSVPESCSLQSQAMLIILTANLNKLVCETVFHSQVIFFRTYCFLSFILHQLE